MKKPVFAISAIALSFCTTAACATPAQSEATNATSQNSEYEVVKKIIWEKEVAINDARPVTGPQDYLDASSDNYVAWSVSGGPKTIGDLREAAAKYAKFPNQEKIDMYFEAMALEGDTAIIYYSTHRTRLGDGTEVDQRYHVGHIWKRSGSNEWKMLGSMVRAATKPAK